MTLIYFLGSPPPITRKTTTNNISYYYLYFFVFTFEISSLSSGKEMPSRSNIVSVKGFPVLQSVLFSSFSMFV